VRSGREAIAGETSAPSVPADGPALSAADPAFDQEALIGASLETICADLAAPVPSSGVEEYVSAIEALARDPARRRTMGEKARAKVVEGHSWDARTASLLEVCRLARERAERRTRREIA